MKNLNELRKEAEELTKGMKLTADLLAENANTIKIKIAESTNVIKRSALNVASALSSAPGFGAPTKILNSDQIVTVQENINEMKKRVEDLQNKLTELQKIYAESKGK